MPHQVDPDLLPRIRQYGAFDINECFSCGNCTAVCPLAKDSNGFPRRVIRYAQLGMEKRLLADEDLWMCYGCGECTQTCPREAGPAQFMSAARRYATTRQDPTGISRLALGSVLGNLLVFVVFSVFFTLLLLREHGDMNGEQLALFDYIPGAWIHDIGVTMFAVVGAAAVLGVATMFVRFLKKTKAQGQKLAWGALPASLLYGVKESLGQMRYRSCDSESDTQQQTAWYRKPWFVHGTIVWGFLGLLAATTLDFLLKPIGSPVPLWYPIRLLGTVAGIVCLYGLIITIARRLNPDKNEITYRHSTFADWFFLLLLFVTVFTGVLTEVVVYLPTPSTAAYVIFLVHVVLAMDLIAMLPVTKFAHVMYRPLALALHHWKHAPAPQTAPQTA